MKLAVDYWTEVSRNIPDWLMAKDRRERRRSAARLHSVHTLALAALARSETHSCLTA